jgi:hypothetical protein
MESIISNCERCDTPQELGDLRCSICGQSTKVESKPRQQVEIKILRCTGCGAAVAYDPDHRAPSCSFCGEVFEVETLYDPMEQSEGFLPFSVDRDESREALKRWLGTLGWFRPSDLKATAKLEELKPLWWVGWVFNAEALVSWTADSNAGSRQSAWAPHSGQAAMDFESILVSASRGLTDAEASQIGPRCNLATVGTTQDGADGAIVEQFDLQRSQARQKITEAIEAFAEDRVAAEHVPGSNYRNVHVSVLLRKLVTRRLSFPAYVLAYRYKNNLYRAVVCGQDGSCVIGSAPYSIAKILAVVAGVIAAGLVIAGLVGMNL